MFNGVKYHAPEGKVFTDTYIERVEIDPRGKLANVRCAVIVTLDKLMLKVGYRKPFAEICEFFANYPTW